MPIDRNAMIATSVASLNVFRCPVTVFWAIGTIIIPAFNAMLVARSRPHRREKSLERRLPRLAYGDSTPAIVWISGVIGIQASVFHGIPNGIFWTFAQAMRAIRIVAFLFLQTATTQRLPSTQMRTTDFSNSATDTLTHPVRMSAPVRSTTQDNPASEWFTREINECRHDASLSGLGEGDQGAQRDKAVAH